MENVSQMSLLEVAVSLMEQKRNPQNIRTLIKEVLEIKGIVDEDGSVTAQLYIDITTSSKFVYMGEDEWDLKLRQSLDQYDKDGSAFNTGVEEEEEEIDNLDEDDLDDLGDEDEEDDEDEDEEDDDEYLDDEDDEEYEDDEEDSDDGELEDDETLERYSEDDFDEDKYNDYMDDFEDMYE